MTLRTIESEFSEQLLKQSSEDTEFDLTIDGPMMTKLHPRLIWAQLQIKHDSTTLPELINIPGWHYDCFASLAEAKAKYPEYSEIISGKPWGIFQFLKGDRPMGLIDFAELGTVVLSKTELKPVSENKLCWHQLPFWISYALSPEIWSAHGKWTLFHSRMHKIFHEHHLLTGNSLPGYYSLKVEAAKLKNAGFIGSTLENSYVLVLPWTFSLTALEKLEKTIRQEFGNVHP